MTEKTKKSYICNSPIDHDGKRHEIGDTIELTEGQAAALPSHAVSLDESTPAPEAPQKSPKK